MFKKQKHKLFGRTKTVDDAFEEQRENFKKLCKVHAGLVKDVAKYGGALQHVNQSLALLGASFSTLFAHDPASDGARFQSATERIGEAADRFNTEQTELQRALDEYGEKISELKNAISKRDDALVLGDAAAESLDKLRESKKEVTDAKLAKHEAEADETRETYVRLNEECGQQLQDFFARRTDDFDLMLKQLVAAQVALFKSITESYQEIADSEVQDMAKEARAPEWATKKYSKDDKKGKKAKAAPPAADSDEEDWAAGLEAPAPLPKKNDGGSKASVSSAAAGAMLRGKDPFDDDATQEAAGKYVAKAAMDEEMQDRAGKAVAGKARDKESQARVGNAIAGSTSNPILKAAAGNRAVQSAAGATIGAAAGNKAIRQAAGKQIAKQANNKDSQKKAAGALKGFMKK